MSATDLLGPSRRQPAPPGRRRRSWAGLALAIACAQSGVANASPRSDPTVGRAVFTGAATPSATSLELNPAAIGLGIRDEVYASVLATLDRYAIERRTLDLATGSLGPGERITEHVASPGGMLAGIWHPGTDGRITLGAHVRTSPAERFVEDRDALRYHVLGGSHRTYTAGVSASVRFSSRFYFGLSLAAQLSRLTLRYARDTALEAGRDPARGVASDCGGAPCGVENPAATERYAVDVKSDLFSASEVVTTNIGVAIQLARDVWLGVAYHAPPGLAIQNALDGTVAVERAPRDGGGTLTGAATVNLSQPASVDAEVRARLPHQLDLHVGMRWEDLSRLHTYDVRAYGSLLPAAGVPEWMPRARGLHDALAVWAGVDQVDAGETVRLGGRLGFETSALPDASTSPWTVSPASLTADAGVQLRVGPQLILQIAYGAQYFPTVDVTDSAFDPRDRLACHDSGFDYTTPACEAVRTGFGIPTAAGEYSRLQHTARLALRYEFP